MLLPYDVVVDVDVETTQVACCNMMIWQVLFAKWQME